MARDAVGRAVRKAMDSFRMILTDLSCTTYNPLNQDVLLRLTVLDWAPTALEHLCHGASGGHTLLTIGLESLPAAQVPQKIINIVVPYF